MPYGSSRLNSELINQTEKIITLFNLKLLIIKLGTVKNNKNVATGKVVNARGQIYQGHLGKFSLPSACFLVELLAVSI